MPRVKQDYVPRCAKHASGQAVVRLNGQDHYLGRYGTKAAEEAYNRLISEWLAGGRLLPKSDGLTINELILAYWRHVIQHYRDPAGQPTRQVELVRLAMRVLKELYGKTLAANFGPLALKTVRQRMIEQGTLCRGTINEHTDKIKRLFRWATENELVPATVFHGLQAVKGLQLGRTEAKDYPPVRPVPPAFIDVALPHCPPHVQAMIRLQLATAMRPGEVCIMRPLDIDMSGKIWIYRPGSDRGNHGAHKTAHMGKDREVYLGPRAQEIVRPFLPLSATAYVFSPAESERIRNLERRRQRKTPMTPSQAKRRPKRNPQRSPGDRYDTYSYRRAIKRACALAGCPAWNPNRLRHNAGTALRREYGIELARIILGHSSAFTTQIYAEVDRQQAMEVVSKVG
jgi:integrase